jgi:hypothetical protein
MYGLGYDRSPTRLNLARREADVALRLAPDLPQGHLAVGLARHLVRGDFREALDEFNLGLGGAPNDAELWAWIGRVQRDLGNWDSAMVAFDHARRLDPRDAGMFHTIGDTFHYLHHYREAIEAYRQEIALAPDLIQPRLSLAWSYVLWKGELDTLRAVLQGLPLDADPGSGGNPVGDNRLGLLLMERRPDSLLALLPVMSSTAGGSTEATLSRALWAARAHTLRDDTAAARSAYDTAAVLLTSQERARPDDWELHATRGVVLAELGRHVDALREVRWLDRLSVARRDHYRDVTGDRAVILLRVGEADAALADIERALAGPSLTTVHMLRLDPRWDPLRGDPRFQALLAKYADPELR